jgi:hypothetical protein
VNRRDGSPEPCAETGGLLSAVQAAFLPLHGRPCWGVQRGHGSFLTFEFGQPRLHLREPMPPNPSRSPAIERLLARRGAFVHGEWHLWIYCCGWLVTQGGERVGESSSHRRMDRAARELNGQALVAVSADLKRGRWRFDFDLGGSLETIPYSRRSRYYDPLIEQWHLYQPDGHVLTVRADGSYRQGPGDASAADRHWHSQSAQAFVE